MTEENKEVLAGKEVDVKFDSGAGEAFVDVDAQGGVIVSLGYKKEQDLGGYAVAKANISISAETNIIKIAEKVAAKTSTPFDDSAVALLKNLLGIK